MKTVKFSLNELMSEIDESFIEEVYFHDCNKILKKYSKQKIRQNVFCKTASKHKPLGYGPSFAADIIKKAKELMVEKGHTYYQSRKLDRVPKEAVEELLGITLPDKQE